MINFIVCDDNKEDRDKIVKIVEKTMIKNDIEYRMHLFEDYNKKFLNLINSNKPNKIYILDIETPTLSGIDVARKIRMTDNNSILIFLTGHEKFGNVVLQEDFLYLSFINKFDNMERRLINSIKKALNVVGEKRQFRFKDNRTIYQLAYNDILYITRDSLTRKTIVKLDYAQYELTMNLSQFVKLLNDDFIKTHRACYINRSRVSSYSKTKRKVTFDNGEEINIISTRFKELI